MSDDFFLFCTVNVNFHGIGISLSIVSDAQMNPLVGSDCFFRNNFENNPVIGGKEELKPSIIKTLIGSKRSKLTAQSMNISAKLQYTAELLGVL